ncbi:GNAT family N-acetyltransferase [Ferruginibacter sp. HRS2-29]|uniref:GNAT family N-acetyltransferase n=1 Tax=Ferruginibacter sp. HRS2-29 TaxID=2487334 RepID=UPI0020CC012E|nr:GNAT family N-acetyltransferase [Ferruginibacter sp. HRS2-29]MCP9753209.1 GNAT family N-acetyltransferase [Ferruginibacter sp. HRS2-29]
MTENIQVIPVGMADFDALRAISIRTFTETFADVNTEENMQLYVAENLSPEKLTSEACNPDSAFFLAKDDSGNVAGYLKLNFNTAQTELRDKDGMEIERIYALKEYHGKSLGKLIFEKALTVAYERKAAYIWLAVWEENARAIAFYTKNGFVVFDKHFFRLGNDVQTDLMMRLPLR